MNETSAFVCTSANRKKYSKIYEAEKRDLIKARENHRRSEEKLRQDPVRLENKRSYIREYHKKLRENPEMKEVLKERVKKCVQAKRDKLKLEKMQRLNDGMLDEANQPQVIA